MSSSATTAAVVLTYFFLNLGLNYYNVFLLGGKDGQLHLPIGVFYTLCHQITIVFFTAIWTSLVPSVRFSVYDTWCDNWRWLVPVSGFYAASIATNNVSFATISLTVNTIFKSSVPFPTMVLSYFIEGKRYSVPIIVIVSLLVCGTILAIPFDGHKHANATTPVNGLANASAGANASAAYGPDLPDPGENGLLRAKPSVVGIKGHNFRC